MRNEFDISAEKKTHACIYMHASIYAYKVEMMRGVAL